MKSAKSPSAKILSLILVLYPVLAYIGLTYLSPIWVLSLACCILMLQIFQRDLSWQRRIYSAIAVLIIGILGLVLEPELGVKAYPVIVNIGLLMLFTESLLSPPNIIETFARKMDPDFSEEAVLYTRKVCIAWCIFFLINGSIATLTLFLSPEVWVLYNGLISYILIGGIFGCEFFIRARVRKNAQRGIV